MKKCNLLLKQVFLCMIFLVAFSEVRAGDVEQLLCKGGGCNNLLEYEQALKYLNQAVLIDSKNKDVYEERAITYFELNRIDEALCDYQKALKLDSNFYPECRIHGFGLLSSSENENLEFSKGLLSGVLVGANQETIHCISSVRGSFRCLWAFTCRPVEVSKNLIEAVYSMGDYLANASFTTLLNIAIPEVMECKSGWHNWNERQKGEKIGFILGKYSIAVFFNFTFQKGINTFAKLKRANMMNTFKIMKTNRAAVVERSAKIAEKNLITLKNTFQNAIVVRHTDKLGHIVARHHAWHKVIKLTGKWEVDARAALAFLKKHNIYKGKKSFSRSTGIGNVYVYEIKVGEHIIQAEFMEGTRGRLLENAWVMTSKAERKRF